MKRFLSSFSSIIAAVALLPAANLSGPPMKTNGSDSPVLSRLVHRIANMPGPRIKGPATGNGSLATASGKLPGTIPHAPLRMTGSPLSIYGNFIYSDQIDGTPVHQGFYRFLTNGEMILEDPGCMASPYASFEYQGKYYQYCYIPGGQPSVWITKIDGMSLAGFYMLSSIGEVATVADLDPATQNIYGVVYTADGKGFRFCRIEYGSEIKTYKPVELKAMGTTNWHALCFDSAGQGYAIDYDGNLLKVDKGNGNTELVGNTGIKPAFAGGAQIDPASGRMFWAVCVDDGTSHIYDVNLQTAAVTHQLEFEHHDQITQLLIPDNRKGNVPAIATDLKADFTAPSLEGDISFHIPAMHADGSEASGTVRYSIRCDIANMLYTTIEGEAAYGSDVVQNVKLLTSGWHSFSVTLYESEGQESDRNVARLYIGYDIPKAPEPVVTYADGKATISWEPVISTLNNAYIDPENIVYNVVRKNDNTVVAEKTKELSITDNYTPGDDDFFLQYSVQASQEYMSSDWGNSNKIFFNVGQVPYFEGFDTEQAFERFTILNGLDEGHVWNYFNGTASIDWADSPYPHDDWLISPPVELKKEHLYSFYIKYRGAGDNVDWGNEKLQVMIGTSPTREGMTIELKNDDEFRNSQWQEYRTDFIVPEDGAYFVGIHCCSRTDQSGVYVDEFSVNGGKAVYAPDAVTDLSVVPGDLGALTVTGTFNAPATDINGDPLQSISEINVARGNTIVKTFRNPAPGETLTFTDTPTRNGDYTYTVIPASDYGQGRPAEVTVYVGVDFPGIVLNARAAEISEGVVRLDWDAPSADVNGKDIDASRLTYSVYDVSTNKLIKSNITETTFTHTAAREGEQLYMRYGITAVSQRGESAVASPMGLMAGTPLRAPFNESFAGGSNSSPIGVYTFSGSALWSASQSISQDDDNGCAYVQFFDNDSRSMLYTAKVDLSALSTPYLYYYIYNGNGQDNETVITTKLKVDGENDWIELGKTTPKEAGGSRAGWHRLTFDLSKYAGKVVQAAIDVTMANYSGVIFDNIAFDNMTRRDLDATTFYCAPTVMAGEPLTGFIKVINRGVEDIEGFGIDIFLDGKTAGTVNSDGLRGGDNNMVSFSIPTNAANAGRHSLNAALADFNDDNEANNSTPTGRVEVTIGNLPAPEGLTGSVTDNVATLSWQQPDFAGFESFTDGSFESATPWSRGLDGWQFIDRDGKYVGGIAGLSIPGINPGVSTSSFFVFDNSAASSAPALKAYDGNKFLASLYAVDDSEVDDWLISPMLTGEAQTLTFHARSFAEQYREKMIIYYSSTDADPASFTELLTVESLPCVPDADNIPMWNEYKVELPEGARYFAIRSCAADGLMLMLDGFDFKAAGGSDAISLKGYNIYRDFNAINDAPLTEPTFADNNPFEKSATYHVSAVYDLGESPLSEALTLSGIEMVTAGDALRVATMPRTIAIEANGLNVSVISATGIILWSGTINGTRLVTVPAGIYIVKGGDSVIKVAVAD